MPTMHAHPDDDFFEMVAPDGPVVKFRRMPDVWSGNLPHYATEGAAGLDICANAQFLFERGDIKTVGTGLEIELPPGFEAQVRSRSGLARDGLIVANAPGTIDSDYRGEVRVIIANIGRRAHIINRGDRIAQLVIAPVAQLPVIEARQLSATVRGSNGFGSTGR